MDPDEHDWRIALIEAHPHLFHPPDGGPETASGFPTCGDGWRDLLERLCARINAELATGRVVWIAQIKEKFGGLRFYWHGEVSPETVAEIQEAIGLAEARSFCTCEQCGEEGEMFRYGGMLMVRCAIHAKGQRLPTAPGMENVHTVRRATSRGFDKIERRYDRSTDTFVSMGKSSLDDEK